MLCAKDFSSSNLFNWSLNPSRAVQYEGTKGGSGSPQAQNVRGLEQCSGKVPVHACSLLVTLPWASLLLMACWRMARRWHWTAPAIPTNATQRKKAILGFVHWSCPQLWFPHPNSGSSCLHFPFFRVVASGQVQQRTTKWSHMGQDANNCCFPVQWRSRTCPWHL